MDLLARQFQVDMNHQELSDSHLFVIAPSNDDMRDWARQNGTIIIFENQLLCRTDNEALTQQLKEKYEKVLPQWFGEVANLKQREKLLGRYGYT